VVERDDVVARVSVEHAAEALGCLVDVFVVRVLLAALEDEVLEEVRHAVLLGALVARARVESDEHRQRARARQRDAVDRQLVGRDGRRLDRWHRSAHDSQPRSARPCPRSGRFHAAPRHVWGRSCKTRCMQAFWQKRE
jgi:hypothetical protein